ncbi:unnamed protein product [Meganyctiphanes norvegica]|uniref:Uncharacterized protein n=1 Tax=Meganyctiphanes norvegica TaxID=48144 RepID=A0AAV2PMS5_MEGNR
MVQLTVVAQASEEHQHGSDCEGITVYSDYVITGADDGKIKVWDSNLKLLREVQAFDDSIQRVVVSNDVVYALSYRIIKAFEFESLAPKDLAIPPFKCDVRCLKADDEYLYVGNDEGYIYTYDLSGQKVGERKLTEPVFDMYLTSGRIFSVRDRGITVSEPRKIGSDLIVLQTLRGSYPLALWDNYLASANQEETKNIVVYNKDSYKKICDIQGHDLIILCMCGWDSWLASGSYDKKLKLWDMSNNGNLAAEVELPGFVMSTVTNGDGAYIYVGLKFGYVCKVKVT